MTLKKTWETPELEVFGSAAELTRMPTPPGCPFVNPGGQLVECSGHKGFFNPDTPDGSDAELSHPADDGFPGAS
jgi:hypothetical protein